jgi:hypothetical protein
MNPRKKGQSAVEYVVTYGWALLFLVIIMAWILASGVLTPSYLVSEECYLGPNLACAFQLYKESDTLNTNIALNVSNGFPYSVRIINFNIKSADDPQAAVNWMDEGLVPVLVSGQSEYGTLPVAVASQANDIKRFDVEITYVSCAPEINPKCEDNTALRHTIGGRIVGRVLEKPA